MLNNVLKTTINNEIFMGKLLQLSFNFQIILKKEKKKKKKVVQVKNLRKKSRKEGDRIHVKY